MNARRLRIGYASGAAAAVLLVLFGGLLLTYGVRWSSESEGGPPELSPTAYGALQHGRSRESVEAEVGRGWDALEFRQTGVAIEPMDAECTYYSESAARDLHRVAQLCFREDRLVRKRLFPSVTAFAPAATLSG